MAKKERRIIGPVELTDMAYGGEAVGRHEGMVLFLDRGAPGDVVNADVTIAKKSFARGRVTEVLSPSTVRMEPPCPFYTMGCGGCQWQHVRYEEQLAIKRHLVEEAFQR
ncbi:MAG TPA: TRAM domain-containing protein, partial [Chloroflexota bacterium]